MMMRTSSAPRFNSQESRSGVGRVGRGTALTAPGRRARAGTGGESESVWNGACDPRKEWSYSINGEQPDSGRIPVLSYLYGVRAVFADCHVGRRPDDDGPFLEALEEAARRGTTEISLLGDVFHFFIAHPKFETPAIARFLQAVERLAARGVPVTYIEEPGVLPARLVRAALFSGSLRRADLRAGGAASS